MLTNGVVYWFYSDLEAPNKMDAKPFFEFNMLDVRDQDLEERKKFTKSAFNLDSILNTASELKYTRAIKQLMAAEMQEPCEEFVRFFAAKVYAGKMTPAVREKFNYITRRALRQFVTDQLNERLKAALGGGTPAVVDTPALATPPAPEPIAEPDGKPVVVTTDDEREAFYIVRAILREAVDVKRAVLRDQQSYCGILLDDNKRKPSGRLYFHGAKKVVGLFDNEQRKEERVALADLDALFACASDQIWTAVRTSSELRDSFASVLCQRMKRSQARLLLPTDEAEQAERLSIGQAVLWRASGETSTVQIPLTTAQDVYRMAGMLATGRPTGQPVGNQVEARPQPSDTPGGSQLVAAGERLRSASVSAEAARAATLFLDGLDPAAMTQASAQSAIVWELRHVRSSQGGKYQAALGEVLELLRESLRAA